MWFDDDLVGILVIALPVLIIISPTPCDAVSEFSVFRLQQFEFHGISHGSHSSLVNVEARTLDSTTLARRCIIAKLTDLTVREYQRIVNVGASALLILTPSNMTQFTQDELNNIWELESTMLEMEVQMAVYFAKETDEILEMYESVRTAANTDSAPSAAAALLGSLSTDGYQLVVAGSQSKLMNDMIMGNVIGKLNGFGNDENLPTIAIVAHYDSFGAAPELSAGADSNGSGVMVLMELARILSKLYSSPRSHPKINVVFLLSSGGFINYQGSKQFIEDQLESSDSSLLMDPHFAMCLDTVANDNAINVHVSKRPKDGSPSSNFYNILESIGDAHGVPVSMVHKKINLQVDKQNWEHEKYSMKRFPAFTLSRLHNHKSEERGTITDTVSNLNLSALTRHTKIIASALLQHIYNTSSIDDILTDGLAVTDESMKSWLNLVSSQPRSAQLLSGKNNPFVMSLFQVLKRYTSEARVTWMKADKRDPDWAFYDVTKSTMSAYAVKPASFDFLLTIFILGYLALVYVFLQYFPSLFISFSKLASQQKTVKIQ